MMRKAFIPILLYIVILSSCKDPFNTNNDPVTYGNTYLSIEINTNKARYNPGETVNFSLKKLPGNNVKVRYSYLGNILKEESLNNKTWSWTPPADDFKGYMIDLFELIDNKEIIHQSIAVDVSSDWKKFPRYGFLSSYGNLSEAEINRNIDLLNRYRLNGIQFYDWMHDHQRPLAGTVENPAASWPDLIGRTNYLQTVKTYINTAHNKGMMAMFYNLAFGALANASKDGVKEEWYLYKDVNRNVKDKHSLDAPFRSSIYLVNPANPAWQTYLTQKHQDVYDVFDFDGYHIDQLGNRGNIYDYNGSPVKLDECYSSFINASKNSAPNKRLVMNAVSGYGQQHIANTEVDFLYNEVWDEAKTFEQLAHIITNNNILSNHTKSTVLAAYMNYGKSDKTGQLNKPGILLTNAVIFAFGGAHLELGEHYLSNEYFPNSNLQATSSLKKSLVSYYDFLVAYQNILRDGGTFISDFNIQNTNGKFALNNWPPQQGSVSYLAKQFADKDVLHFINFKEANSLEWRDNNGTQKEPLVVKNANILFQTTKQVKKIWLASPDFKGGVATALTFTQNNNDVNFEMPELEYWNMVVIEY
jgi:dextranase